MAETLIALHTDAHAQHAPLVEYDQGACSAYLDNPSRIEAIQAALGTSQHIDLRTHSEALPWGALLAVHAEPYLEYLRVRSSNASHQGTYLYSEVFVGLEGPGGYAFDVHAPIGGGTWRAALASASLAWKAADLILQNEAKLTYALCRPPGHHAGRSFSGGYCYINNAMIAASHLKPLGKGLLLDIDYHHGNGTQDILWDDPDVIFASLHADPAFEYPHYWGFARETGPYDTLINVPLPAQTRTHAYLQALDIVLKRCRAFDPQWIVVSLGFDAHRDDPLSTFGLSSSAFEGIGQRIRALNLPTVLVQEGGYRVERLGSLAQIIVKALVGVSHYASSVD